MMGEIVGRWFYLMFCGSYEGKCERISSFLRYGVVLRGPYTISRDSSVDMVSVIGCGGDI